jgi:hypothetical protein
MAIIGADAEQGEKLIDHVPAFLHDDHHPSRKFPPPKQEEVEISCHPRKHPNRATQCAFPFRNKLFNAIFLSFVSNGANTPTIST